MLVKTKLHTIQVLVSKALIDLYINHDELFSVKKKKSKIQKLLWNILYKNGYISRERYERDRVEIIVDSDGILWLNEKHIEEKLDQKQLWMTTENIFQTIVNLNMN